MVYRAIGSAVHDWVSPRGPAGRLGSIARARLRLCTTRTQVLVRNRARVFNIPIVPEPPAAHQHNEPPTSKQSPLTPAASAPYDRNVRSRAWRAPAEQTGGVRFSIESQAKSSDFRTFSLSLAIVRSPIRSRCGLPRRRPPGAGIDAFLGPGYRPGTEPACRRYRPPRSHAPPLLRRVSACRRLFQCCPVRALVPRCRARREGPVRHAACRARTAASTAAV